MQEGCKGSELALHRDCLLKNGSQNISTHQFTVVERSFIDFTGHVSDKSLAFSQKSPSVMVRSPTMDIKEFSGDGIGQTSVTKQANMLNTENYISKHVVDNSVLSEKIAFELCDEQQATLCKEEMESNCATSNFGFKLGWPPEQALSLGSVRWNSFQSKCSSGGMQEVRSRSTGMTSQGRQYMFCTRASPENGDVYSFNWQGGGQKPKEFAASRLDMMLPKITIALNAGASLPSDVIMQTPGNRNRNVQEKIELPPSNNPLVSALNTHLANLGKETGDDFDTYVAGLDKEGGGHSQSHPESSLSLKADQKNLQTSREHDMLVIADECSSPLMGPSEVRTIASETFVLKNDSRSTVVATSELYDRSITTWEKEQPFSESLSSFHMRLHGCTTSRVVDSNVYENGNQNGESAKESHLCPFSPAADTAYSNPIHAIDQARILNNIGGRHLNEPCGIDNGVHHNDINPVQSHTGSDFILAQEGEGVTDEKKPWTDEIAKENYNCTEINRGNISESLASRNIVVQYSRDDDRPADFVVGIENVCLSDGRATHICADAEPDAVDVEATAEKSPLCPGSFNQPKKVSFIGHSVSSKGLKMKSNNMYSYATVDSVTKVILCTDVLDEGSAIGRCCSSMEVDAETMPRTSSLSLPACIQPRESQTSMANSSSSNVVISETFSNSVQVWNLFKEVDKRDTLTQTRVHCATGEPMETSSRRGRRHLKRKSLSLWSSEKVKDHQKLNQTEHLESMSASKTSNSTFWPFIPNCLKRKRSDLASSQTIMNMNNRISRQYNKEECVLKCGVLQAARGPKKEIPHKEITQSNLISNGKHISESRRQRRQYLSSILRNNAILNFKARVSSRKSKCTTFSASDMRHGKSNAERTKVKSIKMASLSSILGVPKGRSQIRSVNEICCNRPHEHSKSRLSRMKFSQEGISDSNRSPAVSVCPEGNVKSSNHPKLGNGKQSFEISWANQQNKSLGPQKRTLGKSISISQALNLEVKMVTVPLKFIEAKRLEPEVLRKESKALLVSTPGQSRFSSQIPKKMQFLNANVKMGQSIFKLQTERTGFPSSDEIGGAKLAKKKRKHDSEPNGAAKPTNNRRPECCICGDLMVQSNNMMIDCYRCGIKVHQACYGVTEIGKKPWMCRPCKSTAANIVCVLCGYRGGAMTRAKKSNVLVKELIQAWHNENAKKKIALGSAISDCTSEQGHLSINVRAVSRTESNKIENIARKNDTTKVLQEGLNMFRNSVTNGSNDPKAAQWVHVVCALWMPGTRCINVATMAIFDVSGVTHSARRLICSICKRAGGACMRCRVPNCGTPFHPWCAHGKGLLQNEAFGGEDEKVGFFGKCLVHGNLVQKCSKEALVVESAPVNVLADHGTCARTDGSYKRGEASFGKKIVDPALLEVLHEDVTAWLSKREHRRSIGRFIEIDDSDKYARYKQEQGWKRLVVYKSSIHALGLYTSESIMKGEMVVEYVGEIIGLRVADKREANYLTNGKLQYRGAFYLFRIDEEHIIDATCKGGIARFANHSCFPNCVAKIISVDGKKKVALFAEKGIAAGEELTYDYKLDFETENRLPCYCKSVGCRGFLN
ncbi:hypothetical protein KP509_26G012000 [Ceratopteris richardii]|uniref:Histone-lysine N-methyltransferase n=1 Tax=Ceratopteris richardii TaxID=49495 RepID=A0A8T2RKR4_CERRI|nr:hypothetical protein KP509_26G012000 [Ceratopteris richardii]